MLLLTMLYNVVQEQTNILLKEGEFFPIVLQHFASPRGF